MALTVDINDTSIGTPLTGCYLRIVKFDGDKEWVRFFVEAHTSEQARLDAKAPVFSGSHAVAPGDVSGPVLPALYTHLKSLPEYAGAQDC